MIYLKENYNLGTLRLKEATSPTRAGLGFVPLKHSLLADELLRQVKELGWRADHMNVWASPQIAQTCVIGMDVHRPDDNLDAIGAVFAIGAYNANNGISQPVLYGGVTLVREKLSVPLIAYPLGEHDQTLIDDLSQKVRLGLAVIDANSKQWTGEIAKLERRMIGYDQANRLILQQAQKKLIGWSQLKGIYTGITTNPVSGWDLVKRYAKAVKQITPAKQMRSTHAFVQTVLTTPK